MKLTETQELTMKIAQVGYESYCCYTNWKSAVTGDNLPDWELLPSNVKNAWFAASEGITQFLADLGKGTLEIVD